MENINVVDWLNSSDCSGYGYGSGYGDCSGYGDGYGSGYGYGSGSGDGDCSGYGDGYGSGYGDGYGSGYGYGSGSGDGDCSGYGYGYGDGSGIKMFNNKNIYMVDNVPTIINHIKGNVAKGFILSSDLTLSKCFVVKRDGYFAHGSTLKKAMQDLQSKIFQNMDTDEKIEKFIEEFEHKKKYKNSVFYEWHNMLTGSCEMGRNAFVKNHGINLDDEMTVDEFIELTINDFGSEIIEQLKERWENG